MLSQCIADRFLSVANEMREKKTNQSHSSTPYTSIAGYGTKFGLTPLRAMEIDALGHSSAQEFWEHFCFPPTYSNISHPNMSDQFILRKL